MNAQCSSLSTQSQDEKKINKMQPYIKFGCQLITNSFHFAKDIIIIILRQTSTY